MSAFITRFCYHCFNFVIIIFDFINLFIISASNLIYILTSFSVSDVLNAFYFNEADIMLFLNHFKLLDKNYYINNLNLIKKLSDYCESEIQEEIRALAEYDQQDWSQIWKQLCEWFYKNDIYQQIYLKSFLEIFKNQSHIMKKNIEIYYFTFHSVFMNLVKHDMLDNHTHCCWFLLDLLKKMWSKFMKKYDINFKNSSMLNFKELYTAAVKKTRYQIWM